jgi:hypothetical protein
MNRSIVLLLTSSPDRCGIPITACRYTRQHQSWHPIYVCAMSRHATLHHTAPRRSPSRLLTQRLYHDYQRTSSTTSTNRPQTLLHSHPYATTRASTTRTLTLDGSRIHHHSLPSSPRSLPSPRSETKIVCYETAGVMRAQAQTMRGRVDSCRTPLCSPHNLTFLPGETAAGTFFGGFFSLSGCSLINKFRQDRLSISATIQPSGVVDQENDTFSKQPAKNMDLFFRAGAGGKGDFRG